MHWALLYTIGALFVSTFILFETGGSFSNEGRHILFTVLCGLMSFVLVVCAHIPEHPCLEQWTGCGLQIAILDTGLRCPALECGVTQMQVPIS